MSKRKTEAEMGAALDALRDKAEHVADAALDLGNDLRNAAFPGDRKALLDAQRAMLRAIRELSHLSLCIASQVDRITQAR